MGQNLGLTHLIHLLPLFYKGCWQILSLGKKKEENDGEKTEANTKI